MDAHGGGEFVAIRSEALEKVGVWPEREMRGGMFGKEADASVFSQVAAVAPGRAAVETLR